MSGAVDALAGPDNSMWAWTLILVAALLVTCVLGGVYAVRAFRSKASIRVRAFIVAVNLTPFAVMTSRGLLGVLS